MELIDLYTFGYLIILGLFTAFWTYTANDTTEALLISLLAALVLTVWPIVLLVGAIWATTILIKSTLTEEEPTHD